MVQDSIWMSSSLGNLPNLCPVYRSRLSASARWDTPPTPQITPGCPYCYQPPLPHYTGIISHNSKSRVHGAPSTLLSKRLMNRKPQGQLLSHRLLRSHGLGPILTPFSDTSGSTHLLEAVLVPGIIIARIVTRKISGMNLEQREPSLSAKGQRGQARPHSDLNSSLFHSHFSSRAEGHNLHCERRIPLEPRGSAFLPLPGPPPSLIPPRD